MANEIKFKIMLSKQQIKDFFANEKVWSWFELKIAKGGLRKDYYYNAVDKRDLVPSEIPIKRHRLDISFDANKINAGRKKLVKYLLTDRFDEEELTEFGIDYTVTCSYTEKSRHCVDGIERNEEFEYIVDDGDYNTKIYREKMGEILDESKYYEWFKKKRKYLRVETKTDSSIHLEFSNICSITFLEAEIVGTSGSDNARLKALEDLVSGLGFELKYETRSHRELIEEKLGKAS